MRRIATGFYLVCLLALAQLRAGDPDGNTWQRQVLIQIVNLRVECLEYFLDSRQTDQLELQRQLEELRRDRESLQNEEQRQREQIAEMERQLSSPFLDAQERPQVEAIRSDLGGSGLERLRAGQATFEKHEADIRERLQREVRRIQSLREKLSSLRAINQ